MTNVQPLVVITGAGSGIGAATARLYGARGAAVMVCDINEQLASETVSAIENAGGNARAFKIDVSNADAVPILFKQIEETQGPITSLVNNVGIEIVGEAHTFSLEDYDRLFSVNVRSMFLCTREVASYMIPRKTGAIANLASVASYKTWPGDGIYSATKAAVLALTKAFAVDLAAHGIRVNAVAPAIVDTSMTERAIAMDSDPIAGRERRNRLHPLGRMATPTEIAQALFFLNSELSAFTTGSCLVVDGGLLA